MNGRVASSIALAEGAMYDAYREWLRHAESCDGCRSAGKPSSGCETGQALWATYREARISPGRTRDGYDSRIGKRCRDPEGKIGILTDVQGGTAYLRPEHGGREWTVPADQVAEEPQQP